MEMPDLKVYSFHSSDELVVLLRSHKGYTQEWMERFRDVAERSVETQLANWNMCETVDTVEVRKFVKNIKWVSRRYNVIRREISKGTLPVTEVRPLPDCILDIEKNTLNLM